MKDLAIKRHNALLDRLDEIIDKRNRRPEEEIVYHKYLLWQELNAQVDALANALKRRELFSEERIEKPVEPINFEGKPVSRIVHPPTVKLADRSEDERSNILKLFFARDDAAKDFWETLGQLPETTKIQRQNLRAERPDFLKIPTSETAKDIMTAMFAQDWKVNERGDHVYNQQGKTQVALRCDLDVGFEPAVAINAITKYGPGMAQTFLALIGLWFRENAKKPQETYLTATAADVLRFQGKKAIKGGYHNDDIQKKGQEIYLLQQMSVPTGLQTIYKKGKPVSERLSIEQVIVIKNIDLQRTLGEANPLSAVSFRYHLGDHIYDWVAGDDDTYAMISGKILGYHPKSQKKHILLGFTLCWWDRVNRKTPTTERTIGLPALLRLANIEITALNKARFLTEVEKALYDLAKDEVIPNLSLALPDAATHSAQERIDEGKVTFPRMIAPPKPNGRREY